jgi:hypothetical protein
MADTSQNLKRRDVRGEIFGQVTEGKSIPELSRNQV